MFWGAGGWRIDGVAPSPEVLEGELVKGKNTRFLRNYESKKQLFWIIIKACIVRAFLFYRFNKNNWNLFASLN